MTITVITTVNLTTGEPMPPRRRPHAPGTRPPRRRHAVLRDLEPGVWHPEAVGVVRGYPATADAFEDHKRRLAENAQRAREAGKLNRRGVPNGWRGQGEELAQSRRNARTEAEMLVDHVLPRMDDPVADIAMRAAAEIAFDPAEKMMLRLRAARLILDFTVPRPTRRVLVSVAGGPLEFLELLAAKGRADKHEADHAADD